jgi:nucleoid-associated protein YgaU
MAIEEYEVASQALTAGETLVKKGDLESAEKVLAEAIDLAHEAEITACHRSLNLAQKQISQLEAQKELVLKAWREAIADNTATFDLTTEPEPMTPTLLTSYTISEGENLFNIAARRKVYGDALLWPLIYKANRDQIKNPQQIYPGQVLTIPRNVTEEEKEQARITARESTIFAAPTVAPKAP